MKVINRNQGLRTAAVLFALSGTLTAFADWQFKVPPKSTFLNVSDNDTATVAPLKIRLSDYGINPGDVITLTQTGNYYYDPSMKSTATLMLGVFSRTDGVLGTSETARIPGALRSGPGVWSQATYTGSKAWTDVPEDFRVSSTGTKIVVPSGARFLFVCPDDCYYSDNTDASGYGVTVSVTGKASGATRNFLTPILKAGTTLRSGALGVAANGTVAGWVGDATTRKAVTFKNNAYAVVSGISTTDSAAYAVDSNGSTIGRSLATAGTVDAFSAEKKGTSDIWISGVATAINPSGSIVGHQFGTPGRPKALVSPKGGAAVAIVNNLAGTGKATGINASGDIVGFSAASNGYPLSWIASEKDSTPTATLLSFKSGTVATAVAINDKGQILGNYLRGDQTYRSFIWDKDGFHDLGTLPGGLTVEGAAINNKGQVVGAATTSEGELHAFLYDGSKMNDLGTLDGNASWATAINEDGLIVGSALDANGNEIAFETKGAPTVTITPSLSLSSSSTKGGTTVTGTVTLSSTPSADTTVTLGSGSANLTMPATVTIKAGATTGTFTVATKPVGTSENATATAQIGTNSSSKVLTILPVNVKSLTFASASVTEGGSVQATVTLEAAVPNGTTTVTLASDPSGLVTSAPIVVPAGSATYTFPVTAGSVAKSTTAKVSVAANGGSISASIVILPLQGISSTISSNYFREGSTSNVTVTLPSPAPAGGKTVTVTASNGAVTVPVTVQIPAGAQQAIVPVLGNATEQNIPFTTTTAVNASSSKVAGTVRSLTLQDFRLANYTVVANKSVAGTFQLEAPALSGGKTIKFWTDNALATVNPTVTVPAGAQAGAFTLKVGAIAKGTKVTIYAQCGDRVSRSIVVQIQ